MSSIAVIDIETTWTNKVMSIGVVIADSDNYDICDSRYYVIAPEYKEGGMFSYMLCEKLEEGKYITTRQQAMDNICDLLMNSGVCNVYAYNARFDKRLLPELCDYEWFDIMRLAAYKQYNKAIPADVECCKTGRLKKDYGVQPIMRLLSGNKCYSEKHNALIDAMDELKIMKLLGHSIDKYSIGSI